MVACECVTHKHTRTCSEVNPHRGPAREEEIKTFPMSVPTADVQECTNQMEVRKIPRLLCWNVRWKMSPLLALTRVSPPERALVFFTYASLWRHEACRDTKKDSPVAPLG